MQKLPVTLALWLAACAHAPVLPTAAEALGTLPHDVIGTVPKETPQGQVTLVTFIATWCFPCLVDLPVLQKLQRDHPLDLRVLLVGMDLEGRQTLEPFVSANAIELPVIVSDARVRSGETPFGKITELPTRFVFRRDGSMAFAYSGVADPKDLIAAVERELR